LPIGEGNDAWLHHRSGHLVRVCPRRLLADAGGTGAGVFLVQFVSNGPDIPDALLQAHEEGRVVFFCGAGISYPAGLPGFKGLVERIYQLNGTRPTDIERDTLDHGLFDATLDLLER